MPVMYEKQIPKVEPIELLSNPMTSLHPHPGAQLMTSHHALTPNSNSPSPTHHHPHHQQQQQHHPQHHQQHLQQHGQHMNNNGSPITHVTSLSPGDDSPLSLTGQQVRRLKNKISKPGTQILFD